MSGLRMDEKGVIVTCASCGQKNRTPFARLTETGQCGKCQTAIAPPAEPIEVNTPAQFDSLVSGSSLPILVDYWAPWCGPCRAVAPELAKVAASNPGRLLVAKVNTEALPELGARFGIRSIPTMALFQNGKEAGRIMGARPASAVEAWVRETVSAK